MSLEEKVGDMLKGNNKEIFNYLVFGVLTTLVNYVSYFGATRLLKINYLLANIIAWVMSGGVETLMLFVFATLLGFNDGVIKIIASVFVVIFNYVVSKFFIFNGEKESMQG